MSHSNLMHVFGEKRKKRTKSKPGDGDCVLHVNSSVNTRRGLNTPFFIFTDHISDTFETKIEDDTIVEDVQTTIQQHFITFGSVTRNQVPLWSLLIFNHLTLAPNKLRTLVLD
uniref:Uncharacterized protein n=1 Tax=Caenorhabditis tropicalis TaxID=1561998 RepID=A0A1I7UQA1_9PELO